MSPPEIKKRSSANDKYLQGQAICPHGYIKQLSAVLKFVRWQARRPSKNVNASAGLSACTNITISLSERKVFAGTDKPPAPKLTETLSKKRVRADAGQAPAQKSTAATSSSSADGNLAENYKKRTSLSARVFSAKKRRIARTSQRCSTSVRLPAKLRRAGFRRRRASNSIYRMERRGTVMCRQRKRRR